MHKMHVKVNAYVRSKETFPQEAVSYKTDV